MEYLSPATIQHAPVARKLQQSILMTPGMPDNEICKVFLNVVTHTQSPILPEMDGKQLVQTWRCTIGYTTQFS